MLHKRVFPGYNAKGADLPPPPICARTWHDKLIATRKDFKVTILVGGYAQKYHLGEDAKAGVTPTVEAWRDYAPDVFPLPHPSWRNTGWLKRNPFFEDELLPVLKSAIMDVLDA